MNRTKNLKKALSGIINRYFKSLNPYNFNTLSDYYDEVFKYSKKQLLLEFNFSDIIKHNKPIDYISIDLSDIKKFSPEKEAEYLNALKLIATSEESLKNIQMQLINFHKEYNKIIGNAKAAKKQEKKLEDLKFDTKMLNAKINEILNQDELNDIKKYKNNLSITNSYGTIHRK